MAGPVNIRIFTPIPFPPLVRGTGPITVTKANGIWTVGFNIAQLGAHVPSFADLPVEYVVVYDSVRNTFFKMSLSSLGLGGAQTQRFANVASTANVLAVAGNDQIINFSVAAASTCALPAAATRNGSPLTLYNVDGSLTGVHKLRVSAAAGETVGGAAFFDMTTPRADVTITPPNDGVSTDWALR